MKKTTVLLAVSMLTCIASLAQISLTSLPSGGNKKAAVTEKVGLTDIEINYDRPGVKGREGKIWGQVVHTGFIDQGFGNSKSSPWRAGANENTTIEFSTDVKIEGQNLPAGKYGFFVAYDPNECTLIFSKNSSSWGSYYYDEKEDALRVKVKPVTVPNSVEWLKYEFSNQKENSATISLQWEKLAIPFNVEVDYIKAQLASFNRELRTDKGFTWESWNQAAGWCLQRNVNLEQALQWADSATGSSFGGDKSFAAWSNKAQILEKLNRGAEADEIMKKSMGFASMNETHQYGRALIQQKKNKEALDIFKLNFQKYPNQFTTLIGLMRGYSANGDYKNALKYGNQALPISPAGQKAGVEAMVAKLKEGKDVN